MDLRRSNWQAKQYRLRKDHEIKVHEQEQRIRTALGLNNGPLPKVGIEWLRKYYVHLAANLILPFDCQHTEEVGLYQQPMYAKAKVLLLLDPDKHSVDEYSGLVCRIQKEDKEMEVPLVDLEVDETGTNFQLMEDYWYWIWNWRFDPHI